MKRKLQIILAGMVVAIFASAQTLPAFAQNTDQTQSKSCGGVNTAIIKCDTPANDTSGAAVFEILKIVIRIMVVGVGVVAVGGLAYGGLLYSSAQDDAGRIQQAKLVIRNVIIGVIVFSLMTVFLNFIIPGGVIG